jgi:hypothetical protein
MATAKILIVDDDQDIRQLLGHRLKARDTRQFSPETPLPPSTSAQGEA